MRTIASLFAAGLIACSMSAIAANERGSDIVPTNKGSVVRDGTPNGQFDNQCAWGLANGKHVMTDCKVSMTREDGKTYCFSNERAMAAFMRDPSKNVRKATEAYGRS